MVIKKRAILGLFILFIFMGMSIFVNAAVNVSLMYPSTCGNQYQTCSSPFKGNITNPGILWEYVYAGQNNYLQIWAVADDINNDDIVETCISAKDNYVRCLNALTGVEVWNASMGTGTLGIPSPLIADLFADGQKQVIQGNREAKFRVFNGTNGQLLWNVSLPGGSSSNSPTGGPLAINLTGDAQKELIFQTVSGSAAGLYTFLNNGTSLWNYTGAAVWFAPALGDMNGDGIDELVFSFGSNVSILFKNGTLYKTMFLSLPESLNGSLYGVGSVALTDINSDGNLEIITDSESGWIYAFYPNGTQIWRTQLSHYLLQDGIAIADIDEDGKFEGVVDCYDISTDAVNLEDGSVLWKNWGGSSTGSVTIADIDNDDHLEVISITDGKLNFLNGKYGYSESTLDINTAMHHASPTVADINGDGFLEIIVGGRNSVGNYPSEFSNKLVAVVDSGISQSSSYKNSGLLNEKSINWKVRSKNVFLSNNIYETLDTNISPSVRTFANISLPLNFSLIGDDLNNDGNVELVGVTNVSVNYWNSSGNLIWNSTVGNSTNKIVGSVLIADPNNDNISEILVQTSITLSILNVSNGNIIWNYTHSSLDVNTGYVVVSDFDGDNQNEIFYNFFQYFSKSLVLRYNKTVIHNPYYNANTFSADMPIADFNKDGVMDGVRIKTSGVISIESQVDESIIASTKIPGEVITSSTGNIDNDSYYDIIVGTRAKSSSYDPASLTLGGLNSGVWGLVYRDNNHSLTQLWNFSSANVTTQLAIGDLNEDNINEVVFGDKNNSVFCIRADNGWLIWNITLPSQALYSPMITSFGNQKVAIVTTNSSIFIFNSSGGLIYNYNDSQGFSYSPIILDLEHRGKGSLLVGTLAGNITLINFSSNSNLISEGHNLVINFSNISYSLNQLGRSTVRDIDANLTEYSSSRVLFSLEGDSNINVTLTNLSSNIIYVVKNTRDANSSDSYQYLSSDNNGALTFDLALGSLHILDIYPYIAPVSECIGCACTNSCGSGSLLYNINYEKLTTGFTQMMKNGNKLFMNFGIVNHTLILNKILNNSVNITIQSDPVTLIMVNGEEKKLNLSSTNYYDFYIKLNNISGLRANFTIAIINESICRIISVDNLSKEENVFPFSERVEFNCFLALGISLFILFILAVVYFRKK